jgi:flagellar hook-basal body complex protein FliE
MSEIGMNEILSQLRSLSSAAQARGALPSETVQASGGFQELLKNSIGSVNEHQQQAQALAKAFETGEANVDLANVMVAMQKASVSFQAMVQVRNKLVTAYQEIMNMPV